MACATHALGQTPQVVKIYNHEKELIRTVRN
jgi:hypothetical protein